MKIWRYIKGNRKGKEAHQIEKEALKDPFLADALEGYDQVKGNHQREAAKLQKQITRRQKQLTALASGKPGNLKAWSIAASILVVVGIGAWFLLNEVRFTENMQITQALQEQQGATMPETQKPQKEMEALDTVMEITKRTPVPQDQIAQATPPSPTVVPQEEEEVMALAVQETIPEITKDEAEAAVSDIHADSTVITRTTMRESSKTLSQVTVVTDSNISARSAKEKKREKAIEPENPVPAGGEKAYSDYLKRSIIRPTDDDCRDAKGKVVLVFKVSDSGRPYQIRVTQGLCSSSNQEAIRLIANGPNWKKGSGSDEATVTVIF